MKKQAIALGAMMAILLGLFIGKSTVAEANKKKVEIVTDFVPQIVYYEETTQEATVETVFCNLTADEREWIAELVAGKAVDRTQTCQQFVANAIFNELLECCGDIQLVVDKYDLHDIKTPTDCTYQAVDEVFRYGNLLLDDDVLWFNDTATKSAFHERLVFVCEIDGIAFYKEHVPSIVEVSHG